MLYMFFFIMMMSVIGRSLRLALRMSWGIGRLLFSFIFLPLIFIGALAAGLIRFAMPLLIVVALASLLSPKDRME